MEHSKEKGRIRDRVKSRFIGAKMAAGAALVGAGAFVAAVPQRVAATEVGTTTTLQGVAADWGMSVPSLLILVMAVIMVATIIHGIGRTQWGYYLTVGLFALFALMTYLGI